MTHIFRFSVGDTVWVRDVGKHGRGYKIEQAIVREQHEHLGRHPFYPNGEGYSLDGNLWWDCYPGCRVFASRQEAHDARLPKGTSYYEALARQILADLRS